MKKEINACSSCIYAIERSKNDIKKYGSPYKVLECTATDKTINIYKDYDDECDKGMWKRK